MSIENALRKTLNLTTQEFIEKAIEGGWNNAVIENIDAIGGFKAMYDIALLDKKAWEAVVEARMWTGDNKVEALRLMHKFIDNLE